MDEVAHCNRIRALDSESSLLTGTRLSRQSLAAIERSGNSIVRSRARLISSHARLERGGRLLVTRRKAA